jgi:hypothetical protein
MRFGRRHKRRPSSPPAPRIDAVGDRGEQRLYDQAFNESHWRRPAQFF